MPQAARNHPPPPADELEVPQYSSGRILTVDDIESAAVREVAQYWARLKGERLFPARTDLKPRDLNILLRHIMLLRRSTAITNIASSATSRSRLTARTTRACA